MNNTADQWEKVKQIVENRIALTWSQCQTWEIFKHIMNSYVKIENSGVSFTLRFDEPEGEKNLLLYLHNNEVNLFGEISIRPDGFYSCFWYQACVTNEKDRDIEVGSSGGSEKDSLMHVDKKPIEDMLNRFF